MPIRVLIVEDRARSRKALAALLQTCAELEVVGEATNGEQALDLVEHYHPDVVLMDVQMPQLDGIQATRAIKERWPEVRVIVLTMYRKYRGEAHRAGADAFLEKGCPANDLLAEILAG